jgi:uncharacterized protein
MATNTLNVAPKTAVRPPSRHGVFFTFTVELQPELCIIGRNKALAAADHGARMQFTREQNSAITVRQVEPGQLRIGNDIVRNNVLLTADREIRNWGIDNIDDLTEGHLQAIIEAAPEMIVVGTGWKAVFPPRELVFALARRGIGFESMDTPAACRTFNILINEGRRAAAALIVNDRTRPEQP